MSHVFSMPRHHSKADDIAPNRDVAYIAKRTARNGFVISLLDINLRKQQTKKQHKCQNVKVEIKTIILNE